MAKHGAHDSKGIPVAIPLVGASVAGYNFVASGVAEMSVITQHPCSTLHK
jgi:hypothetical protein